MQLKQEHAITNGYTYLDEIYSIHIAYRTDISVTATGILKKFTEIKFSLLEWNYENQIVKYFNTYMIYQPFFYYIYIYLKMDSQQKMHSL